MPVLWLSDNLMLPEFLSGAKDQMLKIGVFGWFFDDFLMSRGVVPIVVFY